MSLIAMQSHITQFRLTHSVFCIVFSVLMLPGILKLFQYSAMHWNTVHRSISMAIGSI